MKHAKNDECPPYKVINALLTKNIKVTSTPHPDQNDYSNTNKMKTQIAEIFKLFHNYNQKTRIFSNKLLNNTEKIITKENIILQIRKELKYQQTMNRYFNIFKKYSDDITNYYKENYEGVFDHKQKLRHELKDFIEIIEGYESQIALLKKQNQDIKNHNEKIIEIKKSKQRELKQKYDEIEEKLEIQTKELKKLNNTLNEYQVQSDHYIDDLNKGELDHFEKYEMLEEGYKKLEKQFKFYNDMELKKLHLQLDEMNTNLCAEEENNADLKLQDNLIKNNFLKNIVDEIKRQLEELESLKTKYVEEQKLIRFLGKNAFNRLSQKKFSSLEDTKSIKSMGTITTAAGVYSPSKNKINKTTKSDAF